MSNLTERDAKIRAAVLQEGQTKTHKQIGADFGVSQGVVSGVMFRHRNPHLLHTRRPPKDGTPKVRYAGAPK